MSDSDMNPSNATNPSQKTSVPDSAEHWARDTIAEVLQANVIELRRQRRWRIFFRFFYVLAAILVLVMLLPSEGSSGIEKQGEHAALVDIKGMILPDTKADADHVVAGLRKAFANKKVKGIILRINSPGGSPVQSDYVFRSIRKLRKKHPNIKVYAVCTDVCASGAYYMAAAADQIYANPASMVGSIGVLFNGFGFTGTMQKFGVQRRLLTAGKRKGFMDPFTPMAEEDRQSVEVMLKKIHQQFVNSVKAGRGARLKNDPTIFSGLAWTGSQALSLGLIDGFASPREVATDVIKTKKVVDYTKKPAVLERLTRYFAASFVQQLTTQLGLSPRSIR